MINCNPPENFGGSVGELICDAFGEAVLKVKIVPQRKMGNRRAGVEYTDQLCVLNSRTKLEEKMI